MIFWRTHCGKNFGKKLTMDFGMWLCWLLPATPFHVPGECIGDTWASASKQFSSIFNIRVVSHGSQGRTGSWFRTTIFSSHASNNSELFGQGHWFFFEHPEDLGVTILENTPPAYGNWKTGRHASPCSEVCCHFLCNLSMPFWGDVTQTYQVFHVIESCTEVPLQKPSNPWFKATLQGATSHIMLSQTPCA